MRRRPAATLGTAALLLAAFAAAAPVRDGSGRGGELPLTLRDPRGGSAVRVESGAQALHLVFFATWCPPCRDELPRLAELEARWADRGYRLVLIATQNRHDVSRLARFIEEQQPPGRFLFDAEGRAQHAFGAAQLPTHVLLDAGGSTVARAGALDTRFEQALEGMLRGRRGAGERGP